MITYQIRNFRGCERADLECHPIALIGGRNGMGKTSIAQAAGAILTGQAMPLAGLARGSTGMLVRTGTSVASVVVKGESGTARIEWPAAQPAAEGEPPTASVYAAGLASIATMPAVERVRVLSEYLKSDPTREDLREALRKHDLANPTTIGAIWTLIENKGWDGAHSIRKERGAELKGRWRQITGVNYGSRVAASWRPDLADEPLTEDGLVQLVDQAAQRHERAIAAAAVSQAGRDRLESDAAKHSIAAAELERLSQETSRIQGEIDRARERRAALPSGEQPTTMPCPHCGGALVLRRVSLVETRLEAAGDLIPATELKANRWAIADLDGTIGRLEGDLAAVRSKVAEANATMRAAAAAREQLAAMPPPATTGDASDLEADRTLLQAAQKRLAALRQKAEADGIQSRIVGNDIVLELLAPDGLRGKKLAEVLEVFNRQLADLALSAGWQPVAIDLQMQLAYAGRPYALLSSSEQYRVRCVLQLAMARLDGSQCIVIDAADILDAPTRSGLFGLLQNAGVPAIVCMTLSRREQLPDLASMGLGTSYWVEGGIAEALAVAPREAAA